MLFMLETEIAIHHVSPEIDQNSDLHENNYNLGFNVRNQRVELTIKRAIKKAYFYEGCNFDYSLSYFQSEMKNGIVKITNSSFSKDIFELYRLGAIIRQADDVLDEDLAKQKPLPKEEMYKVISKFRSDLPEAYMVAELFSKELELLDENISGNAAAKIIRELIEIRPSDFFLLTDKLNQKFGTSLSNRDYKNGREFYHTFQTMRDLLDDIMSIEEDYLKKDYNSIIFAKKFGISHNFFDDIIRTKFKNLEVISENIVDHKFKYLFKPTIEFWKSQYDLLFKPLLISYYINLDEFRTNYFMIKQV